MKTVVEVGADLRELAPFRTPGEFLDAVQLADTGGKIDPRLKPLAVAGNDEQGNYSDPHGGFLIPTSHADFQLASAAEEDPAAGRTLPVPMSTNTVFIPARTDKNHSTSVSGGLRVYRNPETVAIDPSRQQMELLQLAAMTAVGLTFATNALVRDSFPSFAAILGASFKDEFDGLFLEERLRGSGVGEGLGILYSPATIVVAKEVGQSADTITGQNVINMRKRCWGYKKAVWIANPDCVDQVVKLSVPFGTAGYPIWHAGSGEGESHPDWLLGRPLFYNERAASLGDFGDLCLVNWSQYIDGTYRPFEGVSSIHVRYAANETAFRFTTRNALTPWWRSSLTPKRGVNTLSPYVVLEERA